MSRFAELFARPAAEPCGTCAHLRTSREGLEAASPGLTVLASAYAAVTAGDGLCSLHDTWQSRRSRCADQLTRLPPP